VTLLLPLALLGLLTLPAILLLHLLRNRREQLLIPSLRLWQGLQQARHGGRPRQIPLSLLLLLQLLVAAAITLALARPAFSYVLGRPQHTIIVLDTSTSMAAVDTVGGLSRFDSARSEIDRYIQTLRSSDSIAVVGLSNQPLVLLQGDGNQQPFLRSELEKLGVGSDGVDLSRTLSLAGSLVEPDYTNRLIVMTDGNFSMSPETLPVLPVEPEWEFFPGEARNLGNQALLDVSAQPLPDGRHRLFARVVNYDDEPVERTLRVFGDDSLAAETTLEIASQADVARVWTLPATAQTAIIELGGSDPLPIDDRAELFLAGAVEVRVLLVSDKPDLLLRVFQAQPGVEVRVADHIPEDSAGYDLLVVDGLPADQTRWPSGNMLVVNPGLGHPLLPADVSVRTLRPEPDSASSILSGIDLSGVFFERAPHLNGVDWATVDLTGATGDGDQIPLILRGSPVPGSRVMVWAFDPDASNLPGRLAFPLLTASSLSVLLNPSLPQSVAVGRPVHLPGGFSVQIPDGHRLFRDSLREGDLFVHTRQPGIYRVFNDVNQLVAGFAVHAGSSRESNLMKRVSSEDTKAITVRLVSAPNSEINFEEYWPWLVGLALFVIGVEGWLAWRK
jgi:hypothetical protein